MGIERGPRIPRVPLPLQRVQPSIEPPRDRLPRHRQFERRVAVVGGEVRNLGVRAQTQHALRDEGAHLLVRESGCGAHFYVEEAGDPGRGDGVDGREGGQVVGGVGADVGEGGGGGDAGVADQGGIVGAVEELGEEGGFVGGEVEAAEVGELGGDGDDEFFREDQFDALGRLDEDFNPFGAASVRGEDVALEEDVWSEFGARFVVELAVVLADCCQEADLQILQDS